MAVRKEVLGLYRKQEVDIERPVCYGMQSDKQMLVRLPLQHVFEK